MTVNNVVYTWFIHKIPKGSYEAPLLIVNYTDYELCQKDLLHKPLTHG